MSLAVQEGIEVLSRYDLLLCHRNGSGGVWSTRTIARKRDSEILRFEMLALQGISTTPLGKPLLALGSPAGHCPERQGGDLH